MAANKEIHEFAIRWFEKYRSPDTAEHEVEEGFADECSALGFEMDCGKAFEAAYQGANAFDDCNALDKIIDQIKDVQLLGSAIFSQWRYATQWSKSDLLAPKYRTWFMTALSRLAVLTADDDISPFVFRGQPQKVQIVSNSIGFGPCPEPDDEVEQRITITADGQVWLSAYNYGQEPPKYECGRSESHSIGEDAAAHILKAIGAHFSDEYDTTLAADIGSWKMTITNTDGKDYNFEGSLCDVFAVDGTDLSTLIRNALDRQDLWVFDGNDKPDAVDRIAVDYHRATKIKPAVPISGRVECCTWNYSEQLVLNRETETLEHICHIGSGCVVSRKYCVREGVSGLLDDLDADRLFAHVAGNGPDVISDPNETKDYEITVDFHKRPQLTVKGTYDKNGLPEDWPELAEAVLEFVRFYGIGEILNPAVYTKAKRKTGDYIFCSTEFREGGKSYYYLTDDDTLTVGDRVFVPVGNDGRTAIVEIVDIEYFAQDEVPFPLGRVKRIIRKCTDEDFDTRTEADGQES